MNDKSHEIECCPKFDPAPWDGKTHVWENKKFIKDRVLTFFYIPLNFGQVIRRLIDKMKAANAKSEEYLGLSDHTSKWSMDLYVAVDKDVPGANNITLSGKFLSKVYEGPFKDICKWTKEFEEYAKGQGVTTKKLYMWYTTCPKCAKKYGKNYVVIFGELQ